MLKLLITLGICLGFGHTDAKNTRDFWLITDPHLDQHYFDLQESCNQVVDPSELGMFGSQRCDSPYILVKSSVEEMKKKGSNPDFILYTGDTPPHPREYPGTLNETTVFALHQNFTALLNANFPNVSVIYVIGNHDYFPKDQLPADVDDSQYNNLAELWFPGETAIQATFKKGGFYTKKLSESSKLRFVVPNTNLYLTGNARTEGADDPGDQLAWLNDTLSQAREDEEYVYLVTHVPFGVFPGAGNPKWLREEFNIQFNEIVRNYADVIRGHFSCHEHHDTIRIYYDDEGVPVNAMLLSPSVTPWAAKFGPAPTHVAKPRNPAVRKYYYDEPTGTPLDFDQYYFDLIDANEKKTSLSLKKLYSFNDKYGTNDLSAASLHDLVNMFNTTEGDTKFRDWFKTSYLVDATDITGVFTDEEVADRENCTCICKAGFICSMRNVEFDKFDDCKAAALTNC